MLLRLLKFTLSYLTAIRDIGVRKLIGLRRNGVHHSRYSLINQPWLRNYNFHTIIDIGANKGEFTWIFADIFKNAEVFAFEPLASCWARLTSVASQYSRRIHLFSYALGVNPGFAEFHVSEHNPSSSLLRMSAEHRKNYPHSAGETVEMVEVVRLDQLFSVGNLQGPMLIKIDVQGAERLVIEGGLDLFRFADVVICELSFLTLYDGEPGFDSVYKLMQSLGLSYVGNLKQSKSKIDGRALRCDALFVRNR